MNAPLAYYNENDPFCAQWLRNLIAAGHIMPGEVDERSIVDVRPDDVRGFVRCHWFAGIAGWDLALRLAGWPDDRPVWTGSCPCQPFSAAGRQAGFADERHLWPAWFRLIRECHPPRLYGEQVEAAIRLGWLDAVFADLEREGYACGSAVFGSHSVGAPHIRQRIVFVADAYGQRLDGEPARLWRPGPTGRDTADHLEAAWSGEVVLLAEPARGGPSWREGAAEPSGRDGAEAGRADGALADMLGSGLEGRDARALGLERQAVERGGAAGELGDAEGRQQRGLRQSDPSLRRELSPGGSGPWADLDWLPCRDGKARPTQPGLQPLAHGPAGGLERMRAAERAAEDEVIAYADDRQADADEVLRMVSETVRTWARRSRQPTGVRLELHEAQVLLCFLLCVEAARGARRDPGRFSKTHKSAQGDVLRSVWEFDRIGSPPRQWGSDELGRGEPSDPLHLLSLLLARHAEAHRRAAKDANAGASRVGKLRAAGNAVNPWQIAAFIRASMP